ncbi:Glycosyltransferase involved in cell wall bisynthesis [Nonlabens sp. Hel1_33_55]|uniref:glycosyltransferase family 2 protein n=1 Tax=Nonlabens sp. Hel1_33_55 TaxID=1336802 RepID=UPI000875AAB6|nr:glycosyltransferase family 2 protein [Nonlabens sp. Hel1_33_55]SCX89482.1 Glycosyltransferase involved in cell wall bisynthesis [Nonlabens sp. Hel1_33_55]
MLKYKISAIVPCFNEAHNIVEVLKTVEFCDEVILVDSNSTDNTVELAQPYIDKLLVREYIHSASQKNWAIPQAKNEWILLVDSDERVTPALKEEIITLFENIDNQPHVGYWIGRLNFFMGKQVRYSGWRNDKVIRFFKKSKCRYADKHVHSEIVADGTVGFLKNKLTHYKYVGMDAHIKKLQRYASHQAKDYDEKTGKITGFHIIIKPLWSFTKHYFIQLGFLDGFVGLTIAYLRGYMVFMRYVKLWLLRRGID